MVMVKTGNECQLTDYMSSSGKRIAVAVCCAEVVVPAKFLLVLLNTLPVEYATS